MTESKVNVVYSEEKGRCLIANENISQGDILLVSKAYALIPCITKKNHVCANCVNISDKKISCRLNCFYVFYCSNQCEQQHWKRFHQHECSFIEKISNLKDYENNSYMINYARLIMRVLTQRFNDILDKSQNNSIENIFSMLSHFDQFTNQTKNEFRIVAKLLTEYILTKLIPYLIKDKKQILDCIQSFLPESTDAKQVETIDCDRWLNEIMDLCSFSNDDIHLIEMLKYLLNKVYILICIEEVNGFFHSSFVFDGYSRSAQNYALGLYPSAVFFNHSCSPNVDRILIDKNRDEFHSGDLLFFATKSLNKCEEFSISYVGRKCDLYLDNKINIDDIIKTQSIRQQRIKDEYFFNCQCTRCTNEAIGKLDESFTNLVKQLKCKRSKCQGWFVRSLDKHSMYCEACGMSQ